MDTYFLLRASVQTLSMAEGVPMPVQFMLKRTAPDISSGPRIGSRRTSDTSNLPAYVMPLIHDHRRDHDATRAFRDRRHRVAFICELPKPRGGADAGWHLHRKSKLRPERKSALKWTYRFDASPLQSALSRRLHWKSRSGMSSRGSFRLPGPREQMSSNSLSVSVSDPGILPSRHSKAFRRSTIVMVSPDCYSLL